MNKYIMYYYNIYPYDIHLEKGNYYFVDSALNNYCLFNITNTNLDVAELRKIYYFSLFLNKHDIYCHQIVLNKTSNIYIVVNNIIYVLFRYKSKYDYKTKINLNDILIFSKINIPKFYGDYKNLWKEKWSIKLDYFEYQLNQFGYKHQLLRESFGYFSGLAELAISLHNNIPRNVIINFNTLSHKRITIDYSLFDLYNPINFIVDSKARDLSEFFKIELLSISDNDQIDNIIENVIFALNSINYNEMDYYLFFVRLLYFTPYFDQYELIMSFNHKEEKLYDILKKTPYYECFIKKIYKYIVNHKMLLNMPKIDWLEI